MQLKSSVGIILVNYNSYKYTSDCINSLFQLHNDNLLNIIVIDNHSTDKSVVELKKFGNKIYLIENKVNFGFSGGINKGLRYAVDILKSEYLWILNNDTIVDKNSLYELMLVAEKHSGILGSKIYFQSGREYHKERYSQLERGNVLWYAGGRMDWANMYASHRGVDEVDHNQYNNLEQTDFITGCSMFFHKSLLRSIGLLDERYYLYFEDLDFCLRAIKKGYKCWYVPRSILWHVNAASSGGSGSQLHEYYQTRNRMLIGILYAPIRTKFALFKESLRYLYGDSYLKKKAIIDFFLSRYGEGYFKYEKEKY